MESSEAPLRANVAAPEDGCTPLVRLDFALARVLHIQNAAKLVAQISNLPYRGFAIRRALEPVAAPAGWKPVIQQIGDLRYVPAHAG